MAAGKARLELRFDADVAEATKQLAGKIGVSVNQLLQGLARWAVKNPRAGEPYYDEGGRLREREVEGCVWWGKAHSVMDVVDNTDDMNVIGHEVDSGHIACALDFTERRVVRDDIGGDDVPKTS
jgi:hypothetical protein